MSNIPKPLFKSNPFDHKNTLRKMVDNIEVTIVTFAHEDMRKSLKFHGASMSKGTYTVEIEVRNRVLFKATHYDLSDAIEGYSKINLTDKE